jgi:hypothetical protein
MPSSDAELPLEYLQENTELALAARSVSTWAQDVPWPAFLNYVLPYARYFFPKHVMLESVQQVVKLLIKLAVQCR